MQSAIVTSSPTFPSLGREQHSGAVTQGRKLRELTLAEIESVNGAFGLAGGFVGAGLGAVGYGTQWAISGNGSIWGMGAAMLGGGVAGAFGGVTAVGAVWGFNGAVLGGIGGATAEKLGRKQVLVHP